MKESCSCSRASLDDYAGYDSKPNSDSSFVELNWKEWTLIHVCLRTRLQFVLFFGLLLNELLSFKRRNVFRSRC